ncbi:MAG: tRNA (adenosine(37)-N6)-threonylcarbamoyltransferase complex dimerization subunit type 1 TsaB [Candidatus Obscuribacterales bacterium]|nr:tRNA (adenosine(37)-N6)-threonylcarbamoyltransferase complex dimerization subunit type 1 TsaB [Candidatus Obscuribacterales bacterium]
MKGTGSSLKLNLVSFDTSSSSVHLALLRGEQVVASEIQETNLIASGTSRQEAANLLIPSIDRLVREQQWQKKDIDGIVVGSGPGSFTGIRTSIVTARALAQALLVPLLPVSLLQCYFAQLEGEAVVVLQAAVGFYFVAHSLDSDPESTTSHFYFNEQELKDFLLSHPHAFHYGNAEAVAALQKAGVNLLSLPQLENVAVAQGLIGVKQLQNKLADCDDSAIRSILYEQFSYEKVVPTYLRNPSVTVKKVTA